MKPMHNTFALAAVFAAVFSSCSKDNEPGAPAPQTAKVMVVHASPNAPAVDVRINNSATAAITNLAFPNNTAYADVPAGNINIKVSPTGTTTNVIDANVTTMANMNYSVIALDSVSKIKASVVADNLAAPAAGKAHVRFFHLSPNAPTVSITTVGGGTTLFANRSFNDQSSNAAFANFTPVDAGTVNLEVRANNAVVLTLPPLALQAGKIYTVFARGFVNGAGNQALGAQVITHN
jgi:hypothetical protein